MTSLQMLGSEPLTETLGEHLDEQVELWHLRDSDMSLHSWLGLTWDEYAALGGSDAAMPLRWRLFPPAPRFGWQTGSDELSDHRWDQIVSGLWVGGYDIGLHGPALADFDLIVTVDSSVAKIDPAGGVTELCCFYADRHAPADELIAGAVTGAAAVRQAGGQVLIRCVYGQNRSAYLAARVLHELGWPTAHAVHQLRARRGQGTLGNLSFVAALKALAGPHEDD